MTVPVLVPRRDLVPETAPFSEEQRVWLSGFFAAALGPIASPEALSNAALIGLGVTTGGPAPGGPVLATNDEAPWHDPALLAPDRMKMAEGHPLAPRLMAAMAQQDCGQCGYNCADYANSIFLKNEKRLNLCAPGGKETARLVKGLAVELDGTTEAAPPVEVALPPAEPGSKPIIAIGTSREAPGEATFLSRRKLNGEGSEKETMHIEFDLGPGLHYEVGDSFGIFPKNHLGHVDQIIAMLGASPRTEIRGRTLRDVLTDEVSLGIAPDSLYELFSYILGGPARETARALARGEDPQGDAATLDVLAVLHKFPAARPHAEAFVDALEPLQPRLYSISSSPKTEPGRLTLTVDAVRYVIGKRKRIGVASTYLGERATPGDKLRVYVQKAHNFALPSDPNTPVIMVGPGTGIAPFRAFLHERKAITAPGPNWLFFGHQRQTTDFLYREELRAMQASGFLTRLSLAWSRDSGQKFYVQDRMREVGATLWQWLEQGAHFYICGDAKRMAKDVEGAMIDIAAQYGGRSREDAVDFVSHLKKAGRYQADVY
ncbi:sulfite reductase subunit alpha [Lichenifustis flavocetrariae]|uniref:assimilatory sulfite reductase (NADPH) n=1 Tax=Lichenifustis flavocetrariae TaxID=2949735 RepID=A0AA41Z1P7_9HYPH|nr:sulfite reductase subunit alpha [Lichenifustis flavocetrariae]MCW6512099.1 sulfite reductase subunit alpha [Lichenifustis flavocetrariae]